MQTLIRYSLITVLIAGSFTSCKKFIEIEPPVDRITPAEVYQNDASVAKVLSGIYNDLGGANQIATGETSIGFLTGFSGDELTLKSNNNSADHAEMYANNLRNSSSGILTMWTNLYKIVFVVNSLIDGVENREGITEVGKKRLTGEARFLRAFCYFYLVNLYGDVPLVLSSDVTKNSNAPRAQMSLVYEQIIEDLLYSKENLTGEYLAADIKTSTQARVRPNSATASALLSRVYLYTKRWQEAEAEATSIIEAEPYKLETVTNVFDLGSNEAIWQLERSSNQQVTDAEIYVPIPGYVSTEKAYYLSEEITSDFEASDMRKSIWLLTHTDMGNNRPLLYPFKYQDTLVGTNPITQYIAVLRLAEQYFIRAEARAHQDKFMGASSAESDINIIRSRAGLAPVNINSADQALSVILKERKLEFFTEWGHRWLDLKRMGKIDEVMEKVTKLKGGEWESFKALYPIPLSEIQKDPALSGHQNEGY